LLLLLLREARVPRRRPVHALAPHTAHSHLWPRHTVLRAWSGGTLPLGGGRCTSSRSCLHAHLLQVWRHVHRPPSVAGGALQGAFALAFVFCNSKASGTRVIYRIARVAQRGALPLHSLHSWARGIGWRIARRPGCSS
jgi:hypothetical protein